MSRPPLTVELANSVYDLLVAHAGASGDPADRDMFVRLQTREFCREYRFQGTLRFGGKFYRDLRGWRVGCYPEHLTPERQQAIDATNWALADLLRDVEADAMWSHTGGVNP